jgi:hypothetical protein
VPAAAVADIGAATGGAVAAPLRLLRLVLRLVSPLLLLLLWPLPPLPLSVLPLVVLLLQPLSLRLVLRLVLRPLLLLCPLPPLLLSVSPLVVPLLLPLLVLLLQPLLLRLVLLLLLRLVLPPPPLLLLCCCCAYARPLSLAQWFVCVRPARLYPPRSLTLPYTYLRSFAMLSSVRSCSLVLVRTRLWYFGLVCACPFIRACSLALVRALRHSFLLPGADS